MGRTIRVNMEKVCKYKDCKNLLEGSHHNLKYCYEHQKVMRSNRKHNYNRVCEDCNNNFISKSGRTKKCNECKEKLNCLQCGNEMTRTANYQKYCSDKCKKQVKLELYYDGNYKIVLDRDENKCVKCNSTNRLSLHHIDYSGFFLKKETKANNNLDNLICLCDSCHQKLHTLTNRTLVQRHLKETKEILDNFLKNKL